MPVGRTCRVLSGLMLVVALSGCASPTPETYRTSWLTTKTPYRPAALPADLEAPLPGFVPVHTQVVARHVRGLSSPKDELALLSMWRQARAEDALTPLGQVPGEDLESLIRANALLGCGVAGVARPGYGNLSRLGMEEHAGLAGRLLERQAALFDRAAQEGPARWRIEVVHSGVDRAADSAEAFVGALVASQPALATLVERPSLTAYPAGAPRIQPPGVNRFLLYFHRLEAGSDLVTDPTDPAQPVYLASRSYQAHARSAAVSAKVAEVRANASLQLAADEALPQLFAPAFVDRLARGQSSFASDAALDFRSDDGRLTGRIVGDSRSRIRMPMVALLALSAEHDIPPGLVRELPGLEFGRYLTRGALELLGWASDAEDFYVKGSGIPVDGSVNHLIAMGLVSDLLSQSQAASNGSGRVTVASLRFTHAEILIPLAPALGLSGADMPVPHAALYRYETNPWRGARVAPYTSNLQWDTWRDTGNAWVRELQQERPVSQRRACDPVRRSPGGNLYEVSRLRACLLG